ncbi:MAG: hypothetical protein ACKV2T_17210 [Kofleriaceae bacterium]
MDDTSVGFTIRFIIVHSSVALASPKFNVECLSYVGREGQRAARATSRTVEVAGSKRGHINASAAKPMAKKLRHQVRAPTVFEGQPLARPLVTTTSVLPYRTTDPGRVSLASRASPDLDRETLGYGGVVRAIESLMRFVLLILAATGCGLTKLAAEMNEMNAPPPSQPPVAVVEYRDYSAGYTLETLVRRELTRVGADEPKSLARTCEGGAAKGALFAIETDVEEQTSRRFEVSNCRKKSLGQRLIEGVDEPMTTRDDTHDASPPRSNVTCDHLLEYNARVDGEIRLVDVRRCVVLRTWRVAGAAVDVNQDADNTATRDAWHAALTPLEAEVRSLVRPRSM